MSKDEHKCDNTQSSAIPKSTNKNITNENVATPEIKILNRGDLLGAINCLFPELQLTSSHIKLKENFSLFSYTLQELTKIFESGRKYRTGNVKNVKSSNGTQSARSLRDSNKINFRRNTSTHETSSTKNMVSASTKKNRAQAKLNTYNDKPPKRYETVQFQSNYTDFTAKFLKTHYPDRFDDFKNIECVIQELNNLYKEICIEDKIGPFNPNLPVLNISECDQVVKINSKSIEVSKLKSPIKNTSSKKKSRSKLPTKTLSTRSEAQVKNKRSEEPIKKRQTYNQLPGPVHQNATGFTDDSDDENDIKIARNIEDLLSDDSFTPRYNAKHSSEAFMIFKESFSDTDQLELEKEAIEQYENEDDTDDKNFFETEATQEYQP